MKINYNDQRLIPFIGGLAIGGLGGAAFNQNHQNYMQYPVYYPNYYYQYPIYYQYPNPQVNIYNPVVQEEIEEGVPLEFANANPNLYRTKSEDYLKYKDVPEMESSFRSDMI